MGNIGEGGGQSVQTSEINHVGTSGEEYVVDEFCYCTVNIALLFFLP